MKYQFEYGEIRKCYECPLEKAILEFKYCMVKHKGIPESYTKDRPNWCPLVEVQDE